MKKFLGLLLVLAIAAPSFAAVSVECNDLGGGVVAIEYSGADDANKPRAFALYVVVDNGAKITDVNELGKDGVGYAIYPGTIEIVGLSVTYNTPVAPNTDPGADTTGIGTHHVVLEMGSLHSPADYGSGNAPDASGELCRITVDKDCIMTISAEDDFRGGIILYDGQDAGSNLAGDATTTCAITTGAGALCPGDVTATTTGFVPGPPPTFIDTFDCNLWDGSDGDFDLADLQALIYLITWEDNDDYVVTPVPACAAAADVTATTTGFVPGPPPTFIDTFDSGLWDGPDGDFDLADLQSLIYYITWEDNDDYVVPCP